MTVEALFKNCPDSHKVVASGALASGELQQLGDGRAAYVDQLAAVASGDTVGLRGKAIVRVPAASGTTFSIGDPVIWDASASLAVNPALTVDGAADYYLGTCHKAKVSGETEVEVDLNAQPLLPALPRPFVYEFDCQTGVDTDVHTLVPAWMNKSGLLVLAVYGIVTEVFAGTEDQGIVTVKDTAGTPNTIGTLTATDAGADAVGDVIVCTGKVLGATTGDAVKSVDAGLGITGQVTQVTTGSAAGKMKLYVLAMPLV